MEKVTYLILGAGVSGLSFAKNINSKDLLGVCNCLKNDKRAAYEEENIHSLIDFVEKI